MKNKTVRLLFFFTCMIGAFCVTSDVIMWLNMGDNFVTMEYHKSVVKDYQTKLDRVRDGFFDYLDADELRYGELERKIYNLESAVYMLESELDRRKSGALTDNSTGGLYNPITQTITIYGAKYDSPKDVLEACVHEVGHYAYYEHLKTSQRDKYGYVFDSESDYVSGYAKKSDIEDFAETLRVAMFCELNYSSLPPKRASFFQNYVNGLFPFWKGHYVLDGDLS